MPAPSCVERSVLNVRQVREAVLLSSASANKLLSSQSQPARTREMQQFSNNRELTCPALSCRDQSELDGNASVAG
jgi:hypothetical protein